VNTSTIQYQYLIDTKSIFAKPASTSCPGRDSKEEGISFREVVTYLNTKLKLVILDNFKSRLLKRVVHRRKKCYRK
jgi:hypothetical protein